MLAIPSPDVLVNLFASAAQVLGLVALGVGGKVAVARKYGTSAGQPGASRWPFRLALTGFCLVGAGFLLYHLDVTDRDNRRLRTNLVRSSQEAGKKVGDTSLKTLAFSDQAQHPRGVTTEQLASWLADGTQPLHLVDVREPEEVEMGRIRGAWPRRYPDLQADSSGLRKDGAITVLLCESGNRSSELCNWFTEQNEDTHFMVGGYEKWVAEGREIDGLASEDRTELRAIREFRNKHVLLDTDAVLALFQHEDALFVDVRYPKEFEAGHLPGAVNVTLRKMTTPEYEAELRKLPKRPIVVPCYDKRSSFYGLILGARLEQLGYDFRGRYTVPHEFSLPSKEKEWVAEWETARDERSLFGDLRNLCASGLGWFELHSGGLATAILLFALLLRGVLAPWTARGDRDRILQQRHGSQLQALKARLQDDPVRLRRELVQWLRTHGIRPGRNLAVGMLQLVLFAALFGAVDRAAKASPESWGWVRLSEPDPTGILPVAVGLCVLLLALVQGKSKSRTALVCGLGGGLLVGALAWICNGGTQLYLLVSLLAYLVQVLLVRRAMMPPEATVPSQPRLTDGLVWLAEAADRAELGGKAQRLGQLVRARFPVPPGMVVAPGWDLDHVDVDHVFHELRAEEVAVRSSACGEDGSEQSHAGEFRTILRVRREGLLAAVAAVRASYRGRSGGVVIQAMVPAAHAGVLFTEDPAHAGRMLLEYVEGLGEALVSGTENAVEVRIGRVDHEPVDATKAAFDCTELITLGRRIEQLYGCPQDIEWARANGRFHVLQARDITRRAGQGDDPVAVREQERAELLAACTGAEPEEVVFATDDYAALLPEPTTQSLQLLQHVWAPGGSVDLAARRLGIPYRHHDASPPVIRTAFGRTVVDRRAMASVLGTSARAGFRIGAAATGIEQHFREVFLPAHERESLRLGAIDLARLSTEQLHQLHRETRERFLTTTYVEAEVVNLVAEAYLGTARRRLQRAGRDAAGELGRGVHTVVQQAFRELVADERLDAAQRVERFLLGFGHRSARDFELSEPRFREDRAMVAAMAATRGSNGENQPTVPTESAELPWLARKETERARRFQELKEEAKHAACRDLEQLRLQLLEIGRRHGLGTAVFDLGFAEVDQLTVPSFVPAAQALAARRATQRRWLLSVRMPEQLTPVAIQRLGEQQPLPAMPAGSMRGARVAGDREVVGAVRVLASAADLDRLQPGEILVARCTDPCWMAGFRRAAGLVTEVGGWLSHAAIQAREHNLPAIVGVAGATARLRDGDVVKLTREGVVERVADRRRAPRPAVDVAARLRLGDQTVAARLLDLNQGGAAVRWEHAGPPKEKRFDLEVGGVLLEASLAWTNCTRFGVRFDTAPAMEQLATIVRAEGAETPKA